ncbi:MAG: biotin transporter BioY, partial [Bacteroidota bacterium]
KVILAILVCALVAPIGVFSGTEIPITLQTLILLSIGMILGAWRGGIAALLYLILGFVGLPVFAEGSSGIDKLWGPSGGFLISFVLATWLVGKMAASKWGQTWFGVFVTFVVGHDLILLIGCLWLGWMSGWKILPEVIKSLLPGLIIKIVVGTLFIGGFNALLRLLIQRRAAKGNVQDWP